MSIEKTILYFILFMLLVNMSLLVSDLLRSKRDWSQYRERCRRKDKVLEDMKSEIAQGKNISFDEAKTRLRGTTAMELPENRVSTED